MGGAAVIPAAKIRGLRQALERDGEVRFNNGSVVRRETLVKFEVERLGGGKARFQESELDRAYEMALNGPRPMPQPPSRTDFGEDAPF